MRRLREIVSIVRAKRPDALVLASILLFNIAFFVVSAAVISALSLDGTEKMNFFQAAFCTVTMILDAGCIQFVVADIGRAGVAVVLVCLAVIIIGMVTFSGAVIGYITNIISGYIENAGRLGYSLHISGHTVIINWNNRASEIVNDMLYRSRRQIVVVLVRQDKEEIQKEIEERLAATIRRENRAARAEGRRERMKNNIVVVVKQGDVFSAAQLHAVCLEQAHTVVLLGSNHADPEAVGDTSVIKELMQVCAMTGDEDTADDQKIVVEVENDRTAELVQEVIRVKQVRGKNNIVAVRIHETLGRMLAQFSLMPELNHVYGELFSNKGASFYSLPAGDADEDTFIRGHLAKNVSSLPVTVMESGGVRRAYYIADHGADIRQESTVPQSDFRVRLNPDFKLNRQKVIILGYNNKLWDIMQGYTDFYHEWGPQDPDVLHVTLIDDEEHMRDFPVQRYPFAVEVVAADICDRQTICGAIESVLETGGVDTNIIILSDDTVPPAVLDANAFANLIYVQDILDCKRREDPAFDADSVDVLIEIIDPRHADVVRNYSVNNIVVSNRYTSKMITQIGQKDAISDIYADILTYDSAGCELTGYTSKEVYIKDVRTYFAELPGPCTAAELVRAVYEASADPAIDIVHRCPAIVLGYCRASDGRVVMFRGDQTKIPVALTEKDKLVVFSNH